MIDKYVDTEELRRLLSGLAAILSGLAIAGLFAIIVVPGLRNANRPETPAPVIPVAAESGWLDPAEFPPEKGHVIPPVDPQTLIAPSADLTARGRELFQNNCIQCHGQNGKGDGAAASTMKPRPRDLSSPRGWTNGYDLPAIYKTLSAGIQGTSMSPFDYLSRRDRMALAHYVQSLGMFPHNTGSAEAIGALSKELAATAEKVPNKIPVSMAIARLVEEFAAQPPPAISGEAQGSGGEIIRRAVVDPSRAAQVLTQSPLWRASARDLAASILPGTPGNGFSVSAAALSPSEWQMLHEELLKQIKLKEGK